MKEALKARAIELGFDGAGIARPTPKTLEHYRDWLARGLHGEMEYLARREPQRADPSLLLPDIRSVIAVIKRYPAPSHSPARTVAPAGAVSCYAQGDDYHDVLRPRLNELGRWIENQTGGAHAARAFIDSGPALERDYAVQAGLGWFGKHTNVLSRAHGNWFFIGVLLTTLKLEPDEPARDHCGTCSRCLTACPTNAFIAPRLLDARRCISYLTIELKGAIPRELRPLMGNRIFGCDDCLAACPWNRFAHPEAEPAFQAREGLAPADLTEIMRLDDAAFRKRFAGSPILRAKRRGLLRNAAIALGNSGRAVAVPVLIEALSDAEALVRGHAAWALGRIGGRSAHEALNAALDREPDDWVKEEITTALGEMGEMLD
ncbi:MAG: tRNA epoxyqueuosine(34) reductase QueG [bacterium]|nr:tRNA epoxyqueuosine(34) reductase QueG [bacterium]